jgi:hypothetical protein
MQSEPSHLQVRRDFWLALPLVMIVIGISGASIAAVRDSQQIAETSNAQSQGAPVTDEIKPAESKPGGARPTTPAPEPARPIPEAEKQGVKAALPPAPAEKIAPPIKEK